MKIYTCKLRGTIDNLGCGECYFRGINGNEPQREYKATRAVCSRENAVLKMEAAA